MSYQKCPICFGSGTTYTGLTTDAVCPTCRGARIIDSVTGLPPASQIPLVKSDITTEIIIDEINKTK